MTVAITHGVGPNATPFLYSVGCTDERLPELMLILERIDDHAVGAGILATLTSYQAARGRPFKDGEVVQLHQLGVSCRLHAVADLRGFSLVQAERQYGVGGFAVTQVEIERM